MSQLSQFFDSYSIADVNIQLTLKPCNLINLPAICQTALVLCLRISLYNFIFSWGNFDLQIFFVDVLPWGQVTYFARYVCVWVCICDCVCDCGYVCLAHQSQRWRRLAAAFSTCWGQPVTPYTCSRSASSTTLSPSSPSSSLPLPLCKSMSGALTEITKCGYVPF